MAEYIAKETLLKAVKEKSLTKYDWSEEINVDDFTKVLNELPPADVAPVVHGQWEPCFEDWRKQIEGDKCSACGFEHYGCGIRNYNFCPNCGARCDLGGAENA